MTIMTEDRTTEFGRQLRAHRIAADMTQAAAADIAEVSVARWRQYEAGFAKGSGGIITALPAPAKIGAVAAAVGWDRDEAYRAAGYDPIAHSQQPLELEVPDVVRVAWPRLSPKWRSLITRLVIEAARDADIDTPAPAAEREDDGRPDTTSVHFSASEDPVVVEPAKKRYAHRR